MEKHRQMSACKRDGDAFEDENPAEERAQDRRDDDNEEGLREEGDLEEPGKDLAFHVLRLVIPIPHKGAARESVKGAADIMMRLEADGYHISRMHTDRRTKQRSSEVV